MKIVKVVVIPALLAVLVYGLFLLIKDQGKVISPLPEEGIKVIQVTPNEK